MIVGPDHTALEDREEILGGVAVIAVATAELAVAVQRRFVAGELAPDIVVEILSPGNNAKEIKIKYDLYEEFGVKEYWVVYPNELSLLKYVLKEGKFISEGRALTVGDRVTTPILPGFELALDDVFRNLNIN